MYGDWLVKSRAILAQFMQQDTGGRGADGFVVIEHAAVRNVI